MLSERDLERQRRRARELGARRAREARARSNARAAGAAGLVFAAVLPVLLWRRTVEAIASEFELEPTYLLTGWSPWVLMAAGLLCSLAALARLAAGRRRFYGAGAAAWAGWGITLYLLGFALATQVSQIARGLAA